VCASEIVGEDRQCELRWTAAGIPSSETCRAVVDDLATKWQWPHPLAGGRHKHSNSALAIVESVVCLLFSRKHHKVDQTPKTKTGGFLSAAGHLPRVSPAANE